MRKIITAAFALTAGLLVTACQTLTIQPTAAPNAMDTTMSSFREQDAERYIILTMTDAAHEELVRGERVDREAELPPLYARFLSNLSRTYGLRRVADWPLSSLDIRCLVFEVADTRDRDSTIAALSRERFVESAQRLSTFDVSSDGKQPSAVALAQSSYNQGGYDQGGYNDPYRKLQYGFDEMQIAEAHRWATGKGVRVAVIDTGLDTRHPELRERITGIRNFVDRDGDAFNADVHGTAVAGVIAAASNNKVGLVGVAPEADLLGLKACWKSEGDGRTARCSTFTLAKALNFAIDQGVDIINLSLGGPSDPLLARLVARALERNILVIGAVTPKWPGGFPAGVSGVVAVSNVAAIDGAGSLIAPGTQVLSTKPQSEYDFYSGSSFSTAYVAGMAALIRQRKPHLPGNVARELIATTAQSGPRAPNACRALARLSAAGAGAESDCDVARPEAAQR
jgi:hypothetical protein